MGDRRSQRSVATTTTAELYQLTDLGGGRVRVEAFGYTEVYSGVSSVSGDFGSDADTLVLVSGFVLPVTAYGRDGNDNFSTAGTGSVNFDGGNNDDLLVGGSAADILTGGDGNDYLDGRGGADNLQGGNGNDVVFGTVAHLVGDTADGGAGTEDKLEVRGTAGADAFSLAIVDGKLRITHAAAGSITVGNWYFVFG